VLNEWRKFLVEEHNNHLPQIYCDMDGVLVDFEGGVVSQINRDLLDGTIEDFKPTGGITPMGRLRRALLALRSEPQIDKADLSKGGGGNSRAVRRYMYDRVEEDTKFWTDLPWMPGGRRLWNFIAPYTPYILTSPMGEGSKVGKTNWLAKHKLNYRRCDGGPCFSHDKWKWATTDGKQNILIDDWDKNLIPWATLFDGSPGGIAIKCAFGDSASAIEELKELGFGE
jgi:hypothetical protein